MYSTYSLGHVHLPKRRGMGWDEGNCVSGLHAQTHEMDHVDRFDDPLRVQQVAEARCS